MGEANLSIMCDLPKEYKRHGSAPFAERVTRNWTLKIKELETELQLRTPRFDIEFKRPETSG